jgi:hypothetical protein
VTGPAPARAASTLAQVRTLVSLRWHMVRSPGVRTTLGTLLFVLLLCAVLSHEAGVRARSMLDLDVFLPYAGAFAGFVVLAVLTPLTAGGGTELFPAAQLVAFPVRPRTQFLASLLLAPLNLAWVAQALTLTMLTGYVTAGTPHPALAQTVTWTYLLTVTVAGQAAAWWIVGVRATRRGRTAAWVALAGLVAAGVLAWRLWGEQVLGHSPTTAVALSTLYASGLRWRQWLVPVAAMLALAYVAVWLGGRGCEWALRRPTDRSTRLDAHHHRRRQPQPTALGELLAVDLASVWRSTPLRRGLLVLGLLPGLFAALASLHWSQMVLLPGLVLAGAGLLFGVNAFCLDGPGALWLASLPVRPAATFASKALTVLEVCVLSSAITVAAASLTARGTASSGELTALGAGLVAETAVVVATCMRWSVRRPHRADLRDSRDTPAPPGAMALYAAGLAFRTTGLGLVFTLFGRFTGAVPTLLLAAAVCALAVRSLLVTARLWGDERVRTWVLVTVATG